MSSPVINIAIADDHSVVRSAIINLLHTTGEFAVTAEACSGKELLEKIQRLDQKPDISILDVSMPIMNGYDTLIALKQTYPEMRFLVLTAIEKEYTILRMIKSGASGYLAKNCSYETLFTAIRDIYATGYYYSSLVSARSFRHISTCDLPYLNEKEMEFIRYSCSSLTHHEIAAKMFLSPRTIEDYQKKIGRKLNIHTRIELALFAVQTGLV